MSSDEEEEPNSPNLPRDSDRGSSVSSDLQDEYEELLRYAVVKPKLETALLRSPFSASTASPKLQTLPDAAAEAMHGRYSCKNTRSPQASPSITEQATQMRASNGTARATSRASMNPDSPTDKLPERPASNSPDPHEFALTEMFVSEEKISKMENILDSWRNNLKSSVMTELRKWKFAFVEQHKLELMKEKEKHAAEIADLKTKIDGFKELLQNYETSNQTKDEVIENLNQVLEKQKQNVDKMSAFSKWRVMCMEKKEEAHTYLLAKQHYAIKLKRKTWSAWHSLVQRHWKVKVEQACQRRAEEVCSRLSLDYEAKLAEHYKALEKAQSEIQRLQVEREEYEESMKKAFMRGVCALNMEALTMFHSDGQQEKPPAPENSDSFPPQDKPGSSNWEQLRGYPTRFSPVDFDPTDPSNSETEGMVVSKGTVHQMERHPSTLVVPSSLPLGGVPSSHRQVSGRLVTAAKPKSSKTVTARITARSNMERSARSNLHVMGVAPPMSSVVVERHHPITQLTIGQAMASKYPRSAQQGHTSTTGRGSSRQHTATCHVHSIKVVD